MTASPPAPTPESVADALGVAELGGDLGRLSQVCLARAEDAEGIGRQRLLDAGAALAWTARLIAALDAQEAGTSHAAG